MSQIDSAMRDRIREFDDAFRSSFDRSKGLPVSTAGVCSLLRDVRAIATREVATFAEFAEDNVRLESTNPARPLYSRLQLSLNLPFS